MRTSLLVLVITTAGTLGPGLDAGGPPRTAREAVRDARAEKSPDIVLRKLRGAAERWPDDLELLSHLGCVLYAQGRLDESFPILRRVCSEGRFEPACAVSVGIDLVRSRWEEAYAAASRFRESDCYRSQRLWTLSLLAKGSPHATEAAKRLVRSEPEKETSYLFLAAAHWQGGRYQQALEALEKGRKHATQLVLLRVEISWRKPSSHVK